MISDDMKNKRYTRRSFLSLSAGAILTAPALGGILRNRAALFSPKDGVPPDLDAWLAANAKVRDAIGWLAPNNQNQGDASPYAAWTAAQKNELKTAFLAAWNNQPTNLPELPANLSPSTNGEYPATVWKQSDAWNFYKASVGQSLALEIGERLPWSVKGYSPDNLAIIFDAGKLWMWDGYLKGYRILGGSNGYYTPAPPDFTLDFMKKIGATAPQRVRGSFPIKNIERQSSNDKTPLILARTQSSARRAAIARVFDWCRRNMTHFPGNLGSTESMTATWQYHGFPPIARVIGGTVSSEYPVNGAVKHWTGGCYGTTGFLSGVLRAVNIPAQRVDRCGHAIPFFPSENLYLTHGDDLYGTFESVYSDAEPFAFSSEELFVSAADFKNYFDAGAPGGCGNIGRRPAELAAKYLPLAVVKLYAADKKAGKTHGNGQVYENFKSHFTLPQLEEMKLWERLEEKLAKS